MKTLLALVMLCCLGCGESPAARKAREIETENAKAVIRESVSAIKQVAPCQERLDEVVQELKTTKGNGELLAFEADLLRAKLDDWAAAREIARKAIADREFEKRISGK